MLLATQIEVEGFEMGRRASLVVRGGSGWPLRPLSDERGARVAGNTRSRDRSEGLFEGRGDGRG